MVHRVKYWGSATIGERGQMVIPADVRKALEIQAGDKLVIFGSEGGRRLMLMKAEMVAQFVSRAMGDLSALEAQLRADFPSGDGGDGADGTSK